MLCASTGTLSSAHRAVLRSIFHQAPLLFQLGLLGGDGPDQDSEYSLSYDVRNRIADLLASRRRHARDPEHLDDVHEGIGQPGDDREPASVPSEGSDGRLLEP